jgi:hypothetical protein
VKGQKPHWWASRSGRTTGVCPWILKVSMVKEKKESDDDAPWQQQSFQEKCLINAFAYCCRERKDKS